MSGGERRAWYRPGLACEARRGSGVLSCSWGSGRRVSRVVARLPRTEACCWEVKAGGKVDWWRLKGNVFSFSLFGLTWQLVCFFSYDSFFWFIVLIFHDSEVGWWEVKAGGKEDWWSLKGNVFSFFSFWVTWQLVCFIFYPMTHFSNLF